MYYVSLLFIELFINLFTVSVEYIQVSKIVFNTI